MESQLVDKKVVSLVAQSLSHALLAPINGVERKLYRLNRSITKRQFEPILVDFDSIVECSKECRRLIQLKRDAIRRNLKVDYRYTTKSLSTFLDESLKEFVFKLPTLCRALDKKVSENYSESSVLRISEEIRQSSQQFQDIFQGIKRFVDYTNYGESEVCDIGVYIRSCLNFLEFENRDTVSINGSGKILINRTLFRLSIIEIITNSIKYKGNSDLKIEISINEYDESEVAKLYNRHPLPGKYFIILFRDNGIGIASDDLEKIFDIGFRASQVRNTVDGTGSGLSICRHFIEESGGTIWAESPNRSGAHFYVLLPAK